METLKEIRRDLVINSDENYRRAVQVYFKDGLKLYGVRTPLVRQIAQKYFALVKVLPRDEIFKICDRMLESGLSEERTIAFDWAYRLRKRYQPKDFKTFERWLINHVSDWGGVDDLCTHALGYFLFNHPEFSQ